MGHNERKATNYRRDVHLILTVDYGADTNVGAVEIVHIEYVVEFWVVIPDYHDYDTARGYLWQDQTQPYPQWGAHFAYLFGSLHLKSFENWNLHKNSE